MARDTGEYANGMPAEGLRGRVRWRFLVALLLALIGLVLYALLQFQGLRTPAVMEQADIARNLATGQGFTTHVVRPFDLWLMDTPAENVAGPIPALWHAPLYPRLLAGVLRLARPGYVFSGQGYLDAETHAIIPLSLVLVLLTAVAVWLLARDLLAEPTANLAGILFLVSPLPLRLVVEGGALPLAMLCSVLSMWLAWKAIERGLLDRQLWLVPLSAAGAGLLAGLAMLSHYAALLLVLGGGCFLAFHLERLRWFSVAVFGSMVLVVLFPWVWANRAVGWWGVMAYPYGALLDTVAFPAETLLREENPVLRSWQVTQAIRDGIAMRYTGLINGQMLAAAGFVVIFFLAGLFRREERHWNQYGKWSVAAMLVLVPVFPLVPGCTQGNGGLLFPFVVIYGAHAFWRMLEEDDYFDPAIRPLLTGLLVLLCLLPAGTAVLRRHANTPYPPYHGPLQAYVAHWAGEQQTIVTDIPWATAWYGARTSLLWPTVAADVEKYGAAVAALYLAGDHAVGAFGDVAWLRMRVDGVVPETLPFFAGMFLPAGGREQVLLLRAQSGETLETSIDSRRLSR